MRTLGSDSPENPQNQPPIELLLEPIRRASIEAFAGATHSAHFTTTPPTYPTVFRTTEFRWLDRLKIDLRQLLHTDQEYEYLRPLREGDRPLVSTRLTEYRERRGLLFVTLESEARVGGEISVIARSTFVVRKGTGETP
jgi:hypothetical protein